MMAGFPLLFVFILLVFVDIALDSCHRQITTTIWTGSINGIINIRTTSIIRYTIYYDNGWAFKNQLQINLFCSVHLFNSKLKWNFIYHFDCRWITLHNIMQFAFSRSLFSPYATCRWTRLKKLPRINVQLRPSTRTITFKHIIQCFYCVRMPRTQKQNI